MDDPNILTIAPKIKSVDDFKKLSILMKPRYKSSRSPVWQFFGTLMYTQDGCDPTIISNDTYCNLCFQEGRLHCYKFSSSSTNLQRHLVTVHNIARSLIQDINADSKNPTVNVKQELDYNVSLNTGGGGDYDILDSKNISSTSRIKDVEYDSFTMTKSPPSYQQTSIASNLAIMCCKDLLPFDLVDGDGFKQFLVDVEAASSYLSVPSSSSVQEEVLINMYTDVLRKVKNVFKESPSTISVAVEDQIDLTNSSFKYLKFKFYFSNENFEPISVSLPKVFYNESNVSNVGQLEQFCWEYNLDKKSFFLIDEKYITDEISEDDDNYSLKIFNHYCLVHSLNDLINVDGLSKSDGLRRLLIQVNKSIGQDLNASNASLATKKLLKAIKKLNEAFGNPKENNSNLKSGTGASVDIIPWHLLEPIFEHILNNFLVSKIFKDINGIEHSLSTENENELKSLLSLFKKLTSAFEILNGNMYASCSLVLLLRVEIETILTMSNDDDTDLSKGIKNNMLSALDSRFPIVDLHVCAALLDPSQRNLPSIREFLFKKHLTTVEFLSDMVKKYVSVDEFADGIVESAGSSVKEDQVDFNNSLTNDVSNVAPWKKMKLEILARHTNINSYTVLEREIQQYMCLYLPEDGTQDDPFAWWKEQRKTLPKLSKLARVILSIPAGCCTIRSITEDGNVCDKIKQLSLNDEELLKFLFLHENLCFVNVT